MNIPWKPKSIAARATVSLLGLWIGFSIAFVVFNRYSNGYEWDGPADLLILAVGCPVAFISFGISGWSAGRRVSLAILFSALACTALFVGWLNHNKHITADLSVRHKAAHQAEMESKYGAKCAKEKNSDNPYAYLICLDVQEGNARHTPDRSSKSTHDQALQPTH